MERDARSVLKLEKLVFEKLSFERTGFSSDQEFKWRVGSRIAQHKDEELYRVTLTLWGEKPDEYKLELSLTGFFYFESNASISDADKKELISNNTIAILMPYLRSEVSLLTAQPNLECIVLPPFNINNLFNDTSDTPETNE